MDLLLSNKTYISCFLLGLLMTFVATPLVRKLAIRFNVVDYPTHRKIHKHSTPLLGGIAIFFGMWLPILLLSFWDNRITEQLQERWSEILIVALAGFAVMLSGILDDMKGLNARKKLLVQVPLAFLFAAFVAHFDIINLPGIGSFELGSLGILITILWIIGITNALNLIDGIDGLAAGVAFFVALTNSVLAILDGDQFLALVMLGMAGACLGFLRYNFQPAKIFLGDTGALFLGMTLATTSVLTNSKSTIAASMLVAVIVLGYPVLDTLIAIARRSLRGKPIFSSDQGHIHHRLLAKGLNHRYAVIAIYIFCALLSMLALAIVAENNTMTVLLLLGISIALALGFYFLGFFNFIMKKTRNNSKAQFKIAHHLGELLRAKMSMAQNFNDICALIEQACIEFQISSMTLEIQNNDIQKNGHQYNWHNPDLPPVSDTDMKQKIKQENFHDTKTGLKASFLYDPQKADEELFLEYFLQLFLIMESAAESLSINNSEL
jgi:UDP-GlcNAc:undecaprenyl-phosphate GlcNAc-1-phosphate transferase